MDQDLLDLEEQQKLYQMEQDAVVLNESINFPDYTRSDSHYAAYLDDADIQTLKDIIKSQRNSGNGNDGTVTRSAFSFEYLLKSLSVSFVGIVDDLLHFSGNLEDLGIIFSKGERLILVGVVLVVICIAMLLSAKQPAGAPIRVVAE